MQVSESRHLPRETSALHNMTLENKGLFLMCLKLCITLSQARKRGCDYYFFEWALDVQALDILHKKSD